jgi:hypothetical protein
VRRSFFRWFKFDRHALHDEQGLWSLWFVEDTQGVLPVESGGNGKVGKDTGLLGLCPGGPVSDGELSSNRFSFLHG